MSHIPKQKYLKKIHTLKVLRQITSQIRVSVTSKDIQNPIKPMIQGLGDSESDYDEPI